MSSCGGGGGNTSKATPSGPDREAPTVDIAVEVLASQRHLAANARPVFVAYTAIDSDAQAQALLQSGFDHVLKKPATTVVLVDLVNTLLGQA